MHASVALLLTVAAGLTVRRAGEEDTSAPGKPNFRRAKSDGEWSGKTQDARECTDAELETYFERFKIGPKYGKDCWGFTEENLTPNKMAMPWEIDLEYVNPSHPNDLALYIYPLQDHNAAFSLCDINEEGQWERAFCKRFLAASDVYTVKFVRVASTFDAERVIQDAVKVGGGRMIHRLVLGGHGSPTAISWGDEDVSKMVLRDTPPTLDYKDAAETTEQFLDVVRPYLHDSAVVFGDACQAGKCSLTTMNFIQFMAYRLAGIEVCGSQNMLSADMVDLFHDESNRPRLAVHNTEGLQRGTCAQYPRGMEHWDYEYSTTCDTKKLNKMVKGEDYEFLNIPCDILVGEGPRERMLCEANQIDMCRRMCASNRWCEAFTFFGTKSKRKQNCLLMKTCDMYQQRHAHVFWKPDRLTKDDVAFVG